MTLFQVALPSILDYLLEPKRSGPLKFAQVALGLPLCLQLTSGYFLYADLPHPPETAKESTQSFLWLMKKTFSEMSVLDLPSGLFICCSQCPPVLAAIFTGKPIVFFTSV